MNVSLVHLLAFVTLMETDGIKKKNPGYKLAKGILLGGLGSVIALDIANLCFITIDPLASSFMSKYDRYVHNKPGTTPSSFPAKGSTFIGASSMEEDKKMEEEELRRKHMWMLSFRILILAVFLYFALSYLMK